MADEGQYAGGVYRASCIDPRVLDRFEAVATIAGAGLDLLSEEDDAEA